MSQRTSRDPLTSKVEAAARQGLRKSSSGPGRPVRRSSSGKTTRSRKSRQTRLSSGCRLRSARSLNPEWLWIIAT